MIRGLLAGGASSSRTSRNVGARTTVGVPNSGQAGAGTRASRDNRARAEGETAQSCKFLFKCDSCSRCGGFEQYVDL